MLFSAARCGPFCDRNTTLDDFLDDRVLLLHNCPNLSSQKQEWTQEPMPVREPLGSQILVVAPYLGWLAIVVVAVHDDDDDEDEDEEDDEDEKPPVVREPDEE